MDKWTDPCPPRGRHVGGHVANHTPHRAISRYSGATNSRHRAASCAQNTTDKVQTTCLTHTRAHPGGEDDDELLTSIAPPRGVRMSQPSDGGPWTTGEAEARPRGVMISWRRLCRRRLSRRQR
ncbi:hypothetical protein MRB53_038047 [Persea americana]|nr:hypothetical protein MRB53_038047 [Persea americana]